VVLIYTSIEDKYPVAEMDLKFIKGIDKFFFPILIVLIILVVLLVFLPDSALMAFLKNNRDSEDLAKLRGVQGFYFEGPKILQYFKNLIMGTVMIYMVALFGITHFYKKEYSKRFGVILTIAVISLVMDLSKAPIVMLILLLFLIKYRYSGTRIRFRRYFLMGGIVLLLIYSIAFNISVWESIPRVLHRLTVSQYVGFPVSFEVFPKHVDYLGVNSISGTVSRLLGKEYIQYSRILMEFSNPIGVSKGTAGYMSTYYLAEAQAIGGLWMLVLASIFTPLYIVLIDVYFRRSNDLFFQAFYMVLLIRIPFLLIDGFTRIFINTELIFLFIVVLSIRFINYLALKYQNG